MNFLMPMLGAKPDWRDTGFVARLLLLALAALLPFALLLALDQWRDARDAQRRAEAAMRAVAVEAGADMQQALQRAEALLSVLARRPELQTPSPQACQRFLAGLEALDPWLANLGQLDLNGQPLCVAQGSRERLPVLRDRPYVQRALRSGRLELGEPVRSALLLRPVLGMALRQDDAAGRPLSILLLSLDLQAIGQDWARFPLPAGAALWIENKDGAVVAAYPASGAPRAAAAIPEQLELQQPMALPGWRVRMRMPEAQLFGPMRADLHAALALLALVLLVVLGLLVWLARRLARPLQALALAARRAAAGDLGGHVGTELPGELRQLALDFNRMLDARAAAEQSLRDSERQYREMLDQAELLAVMVDREGRLSYCNERFAHLAGRERTALLGADWISCFMAPRREQDRPLLLGALRQGRLPRQALSELQVDGQCRLISWSSTPRLAADGSVIGALGIGMDVTESQQSARLLERSHAMLAALLRINRAVLRDGMDQLALCRELCEACVEGGHALLACVWLLEEGRCRAVAHQGPLRELLGDIDPDWDPQEPRFAETPLGRMLRSGQAVVCNDYLNEVHAVPWLAQARRAGLRSVAALPLHRDGKVVGALTLHMSERDWFDAGLLALLGTMADDLSHAFDNLARKRAHAAAVAQAHASLERFRLAASTGNVWAWDAKDDVFHFERNALPRLGRAPGGDGRRASDWFGLVLAEDMPRLREAVIRHLKRQGVLDLEFRCRAMGGGHIWLHLRGQAVWDLHGYAIQMAGTLFDVTARRLAQDAAAPPH